MNPAGDEKRTSKSVGLPARGKNHGPLQDTDAQRAGLSLEAPTSLQQMGRWLTVLGHKDVTTTMIYTHVLNRGPAAVRSPADRLAILHTPAPPPPAHNGPAEIGCMRPQHIPVKSSTPFARPGPLQSRGYPQNLRSGAPK